MSSPDKRLLPLIGREVETASDLVEDILEPGFLALVVGVAVAVVLVAALVVARVVAALLRVGARRGMGAWPPRWQAA